MINNNPNNKNLLVLGGGIDQISGIMTAQKMGFYVIVLDGNNNATAKDYSNEFHVVSIKHIEEITNFIHNQLKKDICGVIAFGVDIPYIISKVSDLLGVNYTVPQESALISEDKYKSKLFMQKYNIAIPKFKIVNNIEEIEHFANEVGFPIIIKPIDNSAARGISFVHSIDGLKEYYEYALSFSNKNSVIVEQFLKGKQISSESLVVDSKIYNIAFLDRNYDDVNRFHPNIIENGGDMPSIYMNEKDKEVLKKYLDLIASNLNIKNGVIKGDLVIHESRLYIIEFALRLSGGNFSTVCIPSSTGVDIIENTIKLHSNIKLDVNSLLLDEENFISMRYKFVEDFNLLSKKRIASISLPSIERNANIICSNLHIEEKEVINYKTEDHSKRLGFCISRGDSRDNAINNTREYLDGIDISFE